MCENGFDVYYNLITARCYNLPKNRLCFLCGASQSVYEEAFGQATMHHHDGGGTGHRAGEPLLCSLEGMTMEWME